MLARCLRYLIALVLIIGALAGTVLAGDIQEAPTGAILQLNNLNWAATQPSIQNNFFFAPLFNAESVCVFVQNLNPTNAHTYTLIIQYTGDPTNAGPTLGGVAWQNALVVFSAAISAFPGAPSIYGASISGAAQISVNFLNTGAAGGSPDTANVRIIQMPIGTACGTVSADVTGIAATLPFQTMSDALNQAYSFTASATNPVANQTVIGLFSPAATKKSAYLDKLYINTTAAGTFNVNTVSNTGTGCTAATGVNVTANVANSAGSQLTSGGCATQPTIVGVALSLPVPANVLTVVDLRGYDALFIPGTTTGFTITSAAAITAVVTASLQFSEK